MVIGEFQNMPYICFSGLCKILHLGGIWLGLLGKELEESNIDCFLANAGCTCQNFNLSAISKVNGLQGSSVLHGLDLLSEHFN